MKLVFGTPVQVVNQRIAVNAPNFVILDSRHLRGGDFGGKKEKAALQSWVFDGTRERDLWITLCLANISSEHIGQSMKHVPNATARRHENLVMHYVHET